MNNRDRMVNTMHGRETDRAPFGVGLGFATWGTTLERWRTESGIADLNPREVFGYDCGFQSPRVDYGTWPYFEEVVLSEDDEFIVATDYRGITARNRKDRQSMAEFLDYPIKTPEDWNIYKAERLQPRLDERLPAFDEFVASYKDNDEPVCVGDFPWGMFGTPRDMMGAEELLVGFYTMPELVHDIIDTYTTLWLQIYEAIAARVKIDRIHIWEDMSGKGGSLISMDMVREFMMPHYDRVKAFANKHEIGTISVDSDGMVDELVPVMMEHGINMFEPFEVQAGNDIREYRKLYPELCIVGGLDKRAMSDRGDKAAIHAELDRCEWMLSNGGRYVPGCDHLVPPDVSWDNWTYFIEELKKVIGV